MEGKFLTELYSRHQQCPQCPTPEQVSDFFDALLGVLFPDLSRLTFESEEELKIHILNLKEELYEMLYQYPNRENIHAQNNSQLFFDRVPEIYKLLKQDVDAMYEGDPAAESRNEVIRSYPGFFAIAAYRTAHELHKLGIKIIPRMITEYAHTKTGVDIHPAATIGHHFCIDHGTGVVIGATTVIGSHVKIYQGVTLGALSVDKKDASSKRHPTIEDGAVIYSGATILGGETIIGHHTIIGGNVWLTKSVRPHSKVYYKSKMHHEGDDDVDSVIYKSAS